jgi:hypothetical protein
MSRNCSVCGEPILDEESGKRCEFDLADAKTLCSQCEQDKLMRESGPGIPWDIDLDCPRGSQRKQ